jgi:hypothetical protein
MSEKIISYKVKVVDESGAIVDKLATNFTELKKSVGDLENELQNTDFGSEQFKDLQKELKNSKGAMQEAQESTMSLGQKFSAIPGPIGAVSQSVQGLGTAFKALVMNPIGAVIAAIALVFVTLYKALTSTEKGMFALNAVMGAFSGLLSPIITLLQDISMVLIDGVLAGITALQNGLEALGFDQFAKASRDSMALAKSINEVEEAEGDLAVERAKQNKLLTEAREILADTNVSLGDRKKALKEVQKSEESLAAKEVKLSEQRLANIRAEIKLKGASKELNDAEEQALITLYNTQQSQAAVRRKNIKAEAALEREDEAAKKEAAAAAKQREKDRLAAIEEKKKKQQEARDFEQNLNLSLITDETAKAQKTIEIQKQALLTQIDNLKVSEEKKKELRLGAEQDALNKLNKIEEDNKKKKEDKEKEDATKSYNEKLRDIQARIALDLMLYETNGQITNDMVQNSINLQRELTDELLKNDQLTSNERLKIETEFNNYSFKLKKQKVDREGDLEREQLQATADAFGDIVTIAGEASIFGKTAAIAQATINTYLSATEAYKALVGLVPIGPVVAPIAAAAAVVSGLATVNKIMAIRPPTAPTFAMGGIVEGQGSMYSDNVMAYLSPGESIINSRSTAMYKPLLSSINEMGGGARFSGGITSNGVDTSQMAMMGLLKNNNKQPVKAYVVSSEMTNQLMLDRASKSRSLI